eukprot:TRINITY_DN72096_c0_g1_i1.p1 TRINITY_DN72096_c0_g1~~TRINITY_DN72096_c0_g1_i1.p1  ORF type:complete len:655 (-),score=62.99 TRINITY_DN72096_c0_g1_i1:45-2009(-)
MAAALEPNLHGVVQILFGKWRNEWACTVLLDNVGNSTVSAPLAALQGCFESSDGTRYHVSGNFLSLQTASAKAFTAFGREQLGNSQLGPGVHSFRLKTKGSKIVWWGNFKTEVNSIGCQESVRWVNTRGGPPFTEIIWVRKSFACVRVSYVKDGYSERLVRAETDPPCQWWAPKHPVRLQLVHPDASTPELVAKSKRLRQQQSPSSLLVSSQAPENAEDQTENVNDQSPGAGPALRQDADSQSGVVQRSTDNAVNQLDDEVGQPLDADVARGQSIDDSQSDEVQRSQSNQDAPSHLIESDDDQREDTDGQSLDKNEVALRQDADDAHPQEVRTVRLAYDADAAGRIGERKTEYTDYEQSELYQRIPQAARARFFRYFVQRRVNFSLFDDGVKLSTELWYSVTPEPVAIQQAEHIVGHTGTGCILDVCSGAGSNSIHLARSGKAFVVALDINSEHLALSKNNADVYEAFGRIDYVRADAQQLSRCFPPLAFDAAFASPPWIAEDDTLHQRRNQTAQGPCRQPWPLTSGFSLRNALSEIGQLTQNVGVYLPGCSASEEVWETLKNSIKCIGPFNVLRCDHLRRYERKLGKTIGSTFYCGVLSTPGKTTLEAAVDEEAAVMTVASSDMFVTQFNMHRLVTSALPSAMSVAAYGRAHL